MASTKKVAVITGGASGMGLAVATALASKGDDWSVHILDLDARRGLEAAQKIGATFHETNVGDYTALADTFRTVFQADGRLDFVFANAGIVGSLDFYAVHDDNDAAASDEPPPPLPSTVVDINLVSVMQTSYLAQHYFRKTPRDDKLASPRSLIITSSCGGIYATPSSPSYAAAKHGCVGWTRSIAGPLWRRDGIRVNAILPGTVRTNLLPDSMWNMFPPEFFTPMDKIVDTVLLLLNNDGSDEQAKSAGIEAPFYGQTVEVNCQQHHFRKQSEYCDAIIGPVVSTEPQL